MFTLVVVGILTQGFYPVAIEVTYASSVESKSTISFYDSNSDDLPVVEKPDPNPPGGNQDSEDNNVNEDLPQLNQLGYRGHWLGLILVAMAVILVRKKSKYSETKSEVM